MSAANITSAAVNLTPLALVLPTLLAGSVQNLSTQERCGSAYSKVEQFLEHVYKSYNWNKESMCIGFEFEGNSEHLLPPLFDFPCLAVFRNFSFGSLGGVERCAMFRGAPHFVSEELSVFHIFSLAELQFSTLLLRRCQAWNISCSPLEGVRLCSILVSFCVQHQLELDLLLQLLLQVQALLLNPRE